MIINISLRLLFPFVKDLLAKGAAKHKEQELDELGENSSHSDFAESKYVDIKYERTPTLEEDFKDDTPPVM